MTDTVSTRTTSGKEDKRPNLAVSGPHACLQIRDSVVSGTYTFMLTKNLKCAGAETSDAFGLHLRIWKLSPDEVPVL